MKNLKTKLFALCSLCLLLATNVIAQDSPRPQERDENKRTFMGHMTAAKGERVVSNENVFYMLTFDEDKNKVDIEMVGVKFAKGMPGSLQMLVDDVDYKKSGDKIIVEFSERVVKVGEKEC